jgi:hypothetical protein
VNIDLGENFEIFKFMPAPAEYGFSLISRNDGDARYIQRTDPLGT